MQKFDKLLSEEEVALARERRLEAMHLQEVEDNPLSAEDIAMFEMFERERWSYARRHEYVMERARKMAAEAPE